MNISPLTAIILTLPLSCFSFHVPVLSVSVGQSNFPYDRFTAFLLITDLPTCHFRHCPVRKNGREKSTSGPDSSVFSRFYLFFHFIYTNFALYIFTYLPNILIKFPVILYPYFSFLSILYCVILLILLTFNLGLNIKQSFIKNENNFYGKILHFFAYYA